MSTKKIHAQAPEKLTGIELKKNPTSAVGFKAIKSAISSIKNEVGLAKGISLLANLNQKGGFDCPGCAWPDPDEKRAFLAEYCENGAKAVAEEATKNRVSPMFFATHSISELSKLSDYEIGKKGRITHPVVVYEGKDHYEEISWEDAFKMIGNELKLLPSPDEAIFYTSGRTSNEAAFLYQLFVRKFGTNNLPDCSNMCHESSGTALNETLGIGKGSVTLDDFNHAELVIVMGQNPGTNHPRMLTALGETKKRGGKIITINPLPEVGLMRYNHPQNPIKWIGKGQKLTDIFLQVKINGDVALLKIILKLLWEKEQEDPNSVFDHQFIASKTLGYDDFIKDLEKTSIEELIPQTGIDFETIKEATELIAQKKKIIICWAMGLTQHKNSVDNIRELVNLLLLKGSIGKQGAGTCPVRGHSNVQGDRTMGIWEKPEEAFLDNLEKEFNFKAPRNHGYDVVDAIEAMHQQKASVFIGMGGNFLSATPDTVKKFVSLGFNVVVEKGAGVQSQITDVQYEAAGAIIATTTKAAYTAADIILKVQHPLMKNEGIIDELSLIKDGAILISILDPLRNSKHLKIYASKNISAFAMEFMPRITRAQSMDVLSSQSNPNLTNKNHIRYI